MKKKKLYVKQQLEETEDSANSRMIHQAVFGPIQEKPAIYAKIRKNKKKKKSKEVNDGK